MSYSPTDYLVQQLRDIGFSESEIVEFLNLVYNNLVIYNKDLESQIAYGGNPRYIDAFHLIDDEWEYNIPSLIEWINSNNTTPSSSYLVFQSSNGTLNKLEVDNFGNLVQTIITGVPSITSLIFISPNSTLYSLTVDDSSNFIVTLVFSGSGVTSKIFKSPNGDQYSLTIDNDGNLIQTKI
jgi:hypothetical protein